MNSRQSSLNAETTKAEVIVCGGNCPEAFQLAETKKTFLPALQDCNRLTIFEPYPPEWDSEMMPSRRTMGDAIILSNGQLLFINGAQLGTAAWWDAEAPNYTPELYNTEKPKGSAARSKRPFLFGSIFFDNFLFGSIEMLIKLIPGNSAGIFPAYYLSSAGSQHDEIDFEFLGNSTGRPYSAYTVNTNIYTQGKENKEQQFHIRWYVDSMPIQVFRNYENKGLSYPNKQGMRVYTSLWNADNWATKGGLVKTNWSNAPFKVGFHHFRASINQCASNVNL
ncbi:xyloglucan endotransglucosylase/hydrolase [Trifolium pratense]|uniref:Xyloglucan endotransglucosylase/hydrolase n=1 Tax=Trifolium pratense TaxID=57577 RepID=A0A2K3L7Y2_TRIPR|nr:xyloglucan endotransglucosylase/hydrolase [Trifolium pratense]